MILRTIIFICISFSVFAGRDHNKPNTREIKREVDPAVFNQNAIKSILNKENEAKRQSAYMAFLQASAAVPAASEGKEFQYFLRNGSSSDSSHTTGKCVHGETYFLGDEPYGFLVCLDRDMHAGFAVKAWELRGKKWCYEGTYVPVQLFDMPALLYLPRGGIRNKSENWHLLAPSGDKFEIANS